MAERQAPRRVIRVLRFHDPTLGYDGYMVDPTTSDWPTANHYDVLFEGTDRGLAELVCRGLKEKEHGHQEQPR